MPATLPAPKTSTVSSIARLAGAGGKAHLIAIGVTRTGIDQRCRRLAGSIGSNTDRHTAAASGRGGLRDRSISLVGRPQSGRRCLIADGDRLGGDGRSRFHGDSLGGGGQVVSGQNGAAGKLDRIGPVQEPGVAFVAAIREYIGAHIQIENRQGVVTEPQVYLVNLGGIGHGP